MSRQALGQGGTSRKGEGSKGARGGPGRRESNSQTKPAATPHNQLRGKTLSLTATRRSHDLHTGKTRITVEMPQKTLEETTEM